MGVFVQFVSIVFLTKSNMQRIYLITETNASSLIVSVTLQFIQNLSSNT